MDFTHNSPKDSSLRIKMFPMLWTQSDIDWTVKLDNSGSYEVRSEMKWLVRTKFLLKWIGWCMAQFYPLDFTHNSPKDSSLHIMRFPKFWTQSDIDWSLKLDNPGPYVLRSKMEWLVYCIVLSIGFHSQLSKRLLHPYYDVAKFYPLDFTQNSQNSQEIRSAVEWLVYCMFCTQSDIDWTKKLDNSSSYEVRSEMERLVYCIVLSIGFYSQLSKRLLPPYYGVPQFYPLDFTQIPPNYSSLHIMMFPKFWTQSDIYWSTKMDNSANYSSLHITMFPKFWTQSDIDWSTKFDNSDSYEVRSEMDWLVYCIVLSIGFYSQLCKRLLPPYYGVPQVLDSIRYRLVPEIGKFRLFYPLDFTRNSPNDSSLHIMMFPKFWTQSDINWSVKLDNSGSYVVRAEIEWLVYA
ncbi:unnamed protein product [Prunus armeniaca]